MRAKFEFLSPMFEFDIEDFTTHKLVGLSGYIDTGFSEFITLPRTKADELGLKRMNADERRMILADGTVTKGELRWGNITIDKQVERIPVIVGNNNSPILLGTKFFSKFEITMVYDFLNTEIHVYRSIARKPQVSKPTVIHNKHDKHTSS